MATTDADSFTIEQVAFIYQVEPSEVESWINEGKLRASLAGSSHCISREDLLAYDPEALPPRGHKWQTRMATPEEKEALWKDYDPEKVRETLERMSGTLPEEEAQRMLDFLYEKRRKYSR